MSSGMVDLPAAWEQLSIERLRGTVLIVGAPDAGKSTFARYAYERLCAVGVRAAYLDGDPGQSTLGPPAAMAAALGETGSTRFPPGGPVWRWFVGAVSPQGHMLPVVIGAARLVQAAYAAGAEVILYDTSGLIDPAHGGLALKGALIDLLQPSTVLAIQRRSELQPLLLPWRRSRRVRVIDLPPSSAARRRDVRTRQAHRAAQFAQYFQSAQPIAIDISRQAIRPTRRFVPQQLIALEDAAGLMLGLGIVLDHNAERTGPSARGAQDEALGVRPKHSSSVTLLTPLAGFAGVDLLHVGDLLVDPGTFRDRPVDGGE